MLKKFICFWSIGKSPIVYDKHDPSDIFYSFAANFLTNLFSQCHIYFNCKGHSGKSSLFNFFLPFRTISLINIHDVADWQRWQWKSLLIRWCHALTFLDLFLVLKTIILWICLFDQNKISIWRIKLCKIIFEFTVSLLVKHSTRNYCSSMQVFQIKSPKSSNAVINSHCDMRIQLDIIFRYFINKKQVHVQHNKYITHLHKITLSHK